MPWDETLSRAVCLFPELPGRQNSETSKLVLEDEGKRKKRKKTNQRCDRTEAKTYVTFLLFVGLGLLYGNSGKKRVTISVIENISREANYKPKAKNNQMRYRQQRQHRKWECETDRDEYIWSWGVAFLAAGPSS